MHEKDKTEGGGGDKIIIIKRRGRGGGGGEVGVEKQTNSKTNKTRGKMNERNDGLLKKRLIYRPFLYACQLV